MIPIYNGLYPDAFKFEEKIIERMIKCKCNKEQKDVHAPSNRTADLRSFQTSL